MNVGVGLQEYEDLLVRARIPKVSLQRAFRTLMQRQFVFGNDFGSNRDFEPCAISVHPQGFGHGFAGKCQALLCSSQWAAWNVRAGFPMCP
jgi:hypothetical protein